MPDRQLHLIFDNPTEVFFPGYPITGKVIFSTEEVYKARAVNIKFNGIAYNRWTEYETHRRVDAEGRTHMDRRSIHYSATVKYLEHEVLLWACRDGSNQLSAGEYCWPFTYTLPNTIPPSFEGEHGYIRYTVTAEIDRPWRFDKAKKRCITVSPLLDLNLISHSLSPLHDQGAENIGACCFKKGYVELKVDIPKTGFVAGETIPINAHILNHGTIPVVKISAMILQRTTFVACRNGEIFDFHSVNPITFSSRETKITTKEVTRISQPLSIEAGKEQQLNMEIRIPSVVSTINQYCPIISVEYYIDVEIDTTSTFNSSLRCSSPFIIGTVPINKYLPPSVYPNNPSLPTPQPTDLPPQFGPPAYGFIGGGATPYPSEFSAPPPYSGPADGEIVVPSAPPMSFEDSTFGTDGTTVETEENEKPFAPKYPVYNTLPIYNPTAPALE